MGRDVFFRDVRRAVSFMAPCVESDSPFTDPRYIERMLQGTDIWLARGTVTDFRPEDFPDLDERTREELSRSRQGVSRSGKFRARQKAGDD